MSEPQPSGDDALRSFFGWMLLLIGGLMTALCGLCTAVFFVGGLIDRGDASFSVLSIFIGGIPTAIGLGLFIGGRALLRPSQNVGKVSDG